jgi:hypothetical protein
LGWKEKFAGAKTSNRLPAAQRAAAIASSAGSIGGPESIRVEITRAAAASARTPGMKRRAAIGSVRNVGAMVLDIRPRYRQRSAAA